MDKIQEAFEATRDYYESSYSYNNPQNACEIYYKQGYKAGAEAMQDGKDRLKELLTEANEALKYDVNADELIELIDAELEEEADGV